MLATNLYRFIKYVIEQNVPSVKNVDWYFDQFTTDETGETDSGSTPRVLIEIPEVEFTQVGVNQTTSVDFILYTGIDTMGDLTDAILERFEVIQEIYIALNGKTSNVMPVAQWNNDYIFYDIQRTFEEPATNPQQIKVFTTTYRVTCDSTVFKNTLEDGDVTPVYEITK